MNNALMFSKQSDEWATPQATFDALDREFGFDLDAAASPANAKVPLYLDAMNDGLLAHWHDCGRVVWCNPPYSQCREFVAKAALEQRHGVTSVLLIPSRTDTKYWHAHIWDQEAHRPRLGVEVRFIKGRLKFGGGKNSAPFPSVVVVFRPVESGATVGAVDPVKAEGRSSQRRSSTRDTLFSGDADVA